MNIFEIEKTQEEIVKEKINTMNEKSSYAFTTFMNSYTENYVFFWTNNPKEICDALGTDAYKVFQKSKMVYDFIKSFDPDFTLPEVALPFEINRDGSVTIE